MAFVFYIVRRSSFSCNWLRLVEIRVKDNIYNRTLVCHSTLLDIIGEWFGSCDVCFKKNVLFYHPYKNTAKKSLYMTYYPSQKSVPHLKTTDQFTKT